MQPVGYKILSSILRSRITNYLCANKFVDSTIQKGFWPKSNGVTEHTAVLTHIINEARRYQRSLIVTLLDLRNAFGEVSHGLIKKSLELHNIPLPIIELIANIYKHASVTIGVNKQITEKIKVNRGVLQGDPCSPLLFNLCFNILVRTIAQEKYKALGFAWGPTNAPTNTSWLQFADDAALIAHDSKSAQALVDIAAAWCEWAHMIIRTDKCSTFGMAKIKGAYVQTEPKIYNNSIVIPPIKMGESFKYLGKNFSFQMKNQEVKDILLHKIKTLLEKISTLKIPIQLKLKILRLYLPTQINFELRMYNISHTWITNNLDFAIINSVRSWLQYPINTCVAEIMHLPLSKGGLGIPPLASIAQKQGLSVRATLKNNSDSTMRSLWEATSDKNIANDSLLINNNVDTANKQLKNDLLMKSLNHVQNLQVQGSAIMAVTAALNKSEITRWLNCTLTLSDQHIKFARRALQQQLATASNMVRWKRANSNLCTLCQDVQTNKHVLSNCPAPAALLRCTTRHDRILLILAGYLHTHIQSPNKLHVDLQGVFANKPFI